MGFFDQVVNRSSGGGGDYGGGGGGYAPSGSSNQGWQAFNVLRQQIADRNQQLLGQSGPDYFAGTQAGPSAWQGYVDNYNRQNDIGRDNQRDRGMFSMSGGTKSMYNDRYRKANLFDTAAIKAGEAGEWWMNLPSNIANMAGNQQLAQDLKFDATKFDLSNGLDDQDLQQVGNFALSLPGMIPGGIFEGLSKGYEGLTGKPVRENRKLADGSYEYADYDMDFSQRAADLVDAGIDIAGPFLGASGKAVSVVGKGVGRAAAGRMEKAAASAIAGDSEQAAKLALEADKLRKKAERLNKFTANMGKGVFERAGFKGGAGMQFGYNVAEEAGEEYVQSYMEDIRNKELNENSFNKALTSAAWGAAGGGMMHAGGAVLNKLAHGSFDEKHAGGSTEDVDPADAIQAGQSQHNAFEKFDDRNNVYSGVEVTDAINRRAREKQKNPDDVPASGSAYGVNRDDALDITKIRLTLGMLDGVVQTNDNGRSIAGLAETFHTTADEINRISSIRDNAQRHAAWVALLESAKAKGPVRIVAGRNPDTNGVGTAYMDIASIDRGYGVSMNANAWKMLGGDTDGDRYQVYLHPEGGIRPNGYLTDVFSDSQGYTRLSDDYTKWLVKDGHLEENKKQVQGIRDSVSDFLKSADEAMKAKYGVTSFLTDEERKGIVNAYYKAATREGSDLNTMTSWLQYAQGVFGKALGRIEKSDRQDAARMTGEMMQAMHVKATETASTFEDVVAAKGLELEQALDNVLEDELFLNPGDNKGKTRAAQLMADLGDKTGTNVGLPLGNPIMRQTARMRFESMEDLNVYFNAGTMSKTDVEDRIANLIAFSFSLEGVGANVENTIETVFWSSVFDMSLTRFMSGKDGHVDIAANWGDFSKILAEEYKTAAVRFNDVMERPGTSWSSKVKIGATKNVDLADTQQGLAQVFRKVFGHVTIDSLMNLPSNHPLSDLTINQIAGEYSIGNAGSFGPFGATPEFNKFFKHVMKDIGATFRATEARYRSSMQETADTLLEYGMTDVDSLIRLEYDDNGRAIGHEWLTDDFTALKFAIESAHYTFGEDVCTSLGIHTMEGFLTSRWGREWMSGDVDRMMNAVFSAKTTYLYDNVINSATARQAGWENEVEDELIRLQSEGGLFESLVYAYFKENDGSLEFLRQLTSLDVKFDQKERLWEQMTKKDDSIGGIFSEMIATPNSTLGTSAFTKNLKDAKRSLAEVRKRSSVHNRQVLKQIEDSDLGNETKVRAIKHFFGKGYTSMSTHAVAAFVDSQRDVVKGMMDKGVAPSSTDIVYQMSERFKDGQLFSYLEGLDYNFGTMTIGGLQTNKVQICKILSDPEARIRVYDRRKNGYLDVTREAIFREVLGDKYDHYDIDNDWEPWRALLDRCPALVSIVAPTHIGTRAKDGETSIVEGTKKSLFEAMSDYKENAIDFDKQYQREQLENEVLGIAMRDPNWWSAFVADPGFARASSLAATHDATTKLLKKHVDWIMKWASQPQGGEEYINRCKLIGDRARRGAMRHVEKMQADGRIMDYIRTTRGSVESGLYSDMSASMMRFIVDGGVNNLLMGHGLFITNDKVVDANDKQTQQEMMARMMQEFFNFDLSKMGIPDMNIMMDEFKKYVQGQMNMMFIMDNMVDDHLFHYEQLYNQHDRIGQVRTMLRDYLTDLDDNARPAAQENLNPVFTALNEWESGSFAGFSKLIFGEDIMTKAAEQFAPLVITNDAVDSMTQEQFTEAVFKICREYNFNEDQGKIKKAIKEAFDEENNPNAREERVNLKNYFNQIILNYELNRITPGGTTQNHLAPKQTIEAYRSMIRVGDKVRSEMAGRLQPDTDPLPELSFNFEDPVTSVMSSHMAMNAASGSITTGIGLDGSMLSCLAGFGLIDTYECGALPTIVESGTLDPDVVVGASYRYSIPETNNAGETVKNPDGTVKMKTVEGHFTGRKDVDRINAMGVQVEVWLVDNCMCGGCARCAPMSDSRSERGSHGKNNYSPIGRKVSHLINWMQEPRHLRAKKTLAKIGAFADPREVNRTMQKPYTVDEVGAGTAREMILKALSKRREVLRDELNAAFRAPEVAGDLHFDEDGSKAESTMFAGLMTNFIEVSVEGQGTFIVSAASLVNDETFLGKGYPFVDENGNMATAGVTFNPVVMSLQEVAETITRNVVENYYLAKENGEKVTAQQIRDWANDAMGNWDGYNSNPISMKEFLDGIVPNPDIVDNPILGDANPTTRMLWNDDLSHYVSRTKSPENAPAITYMGNEAWNRVKDFNQRILDDGSQLGNLRIVSVSGKPPAPGESTSMFGKDMSTLFSENKLRSLPDDTGTSATIYDDFARKSYHLVEMYIGGDTDQVEKAVDAYHAAAAKGRNVLIPTGIANQMRGVYRTGNERTVTIGGKDFTLLNTEPQGYLNKFQKDRVALATVEMDPDDITIAMGSAHRLGLADAATYSHPDLEVHRRFTQEVDVIPTAILDYWTTPVRLADGSTDFSKVSVDDVDFHYYDNNLRKRNVGSADRMWDDDQGNSRYEAQSYRDAVQHYLDLASDPGFDPSYLTNVKQGDCIGLVAQVGVNGKTVYAPIFYEGTVAHTADIVTITEDRFGHVKCRASSSNVDYNGNEDVKLDLYGVAYKTMTHRAPEEILRKWGAINDGGFKLANRPDYMFDDMSITSRLIEMGDRLLHQNVYFFTRKAGVNAFFSRNDKGEWVTRDDLHADMTWQRLVDLAAGSHKAWANVADGSWHVYADAKADMLFKRCCQDIMGLGGYPHLFFNSARVIPTVNPETGERTLSFKGRERRRFDPCAVFKNWNTDDFLALWNNIDSRLVPASLEEDRANHEKTFDAQGRMLDYNTEDGTPQRKTTVIGLNFYTSGQGNAVSDLSRGAAYSDQHVLQDLLRSGVYSKYLKDTIEALSVGVGNIDSVVRKATVEEELEHWRKHKGEKRQLNQAMYDRAQEMIKDPLVSSLIDTRRQNFLDIIDDIDTPLPIVNSLKDNTSAFADPVKAREIETLLKSFNESLAAGRPQAANVDLRLEEVVMLVRSMTGTTTHTNLGITSMTYDQFKQAVEMMIQNRREGHDPIMGGRYMHRGNDDRVSIPLLPKGLTMRLAQTNYYMDQYHGNVDEIINVQYEQLKTATLDAIKLVKDKPKQRALYQFADAMCYANGKDTISGNILGNIYMNDLISAARDFSFALTDYDPSIFDKYDEACKLNAEWVEKVRRSEEMRDMTRVDLGDGKYDIMATGEPRNIMVYTMRQLAAARKAIGLTYIEMPLSNCLDRAVGQTGISFALGLGRHGVGPYTVKQRLNEDLRQTTPQRDDMRAFWSALREAQLYGVDRQLLNEVYNGVDLQQAIQNCIKDQGVIERLNNKIMNIASGKDWGIEKQVQNFLDRFWQRSETEAPWWHMPAPDNPKVSVFEMRMQEDPVGLVIDLFSGSGEGRQADVLLARQCLQFALAGDMSQKNLVSAIHTEIAKRSALADFGMTTFVSPYFQYATNRLGRVLQAVAPVSSLNYMATEFFSQGPGSDIGVPGLNGVTFGDLGLDEYQVKANLKEACVVDMMHMGGTLVAMVIAGLALSMPGVLEPPDDPDKRGNFEEWTFMGMRINANWWIEDSLGIALPLATFMTSAMRGEPRIDLIVNGAAHYLSSNPLVKVADVVSVMFDPMSELYQDYENDVEGYAKAMGGPPDVFTVAKGKATSFGLSYVSQFVTPGFLREIYQAGQGNEVAYKRIFETDQTGRLTLAAREQNRTQYTSYEDAVLRRFTKDNPVMGFLADVIFRPQTGYMNHEMPDRVIYDPELMNSIEAFSMYEDPYTKKVEKSDAEKFATAQMVIATLEGNSVESLVQQGFMIDYETKKVVGQVIWDMIAAENDQWAQLEQNGALSYYNAGYGSYDENVAVISEMRQTHYNYINYLKDLFNNKLWSDELKAVPTYNQHDTEWAQDVNGNWYATGFESTTLLSPIKIAPGESPGVPQAVMGPENDWQTQSVMTGNPTGQRALIWNDPDAGNTIEKPALKSYSEDGTDTGHSSLYNSVLNELSGNGDKDGNGNGKDKNGKNPYGNKYPRRSYGGGGGGRRGGGGGGGSRRKYGSGVPNAYAPSVSAPTAAYVPKGSTPRLSLSKTMNTDNLVRPNEQYLRPDFETKGSREAYKRSDI